MKRRSSDMRLAAFPAHGNRLDWREARPGNGSPIGSGAIIANGTLVSERERPPLAQATIASTTVQRRWPWVGVGGVPKRAGRGLDSTCRSERGRGRERRGERGEEGGWQASREREREGEMDGRKREGRFVNAEISRVAPRREPSVDSQSRCERSKERYGCFTLDVGRRVRHRPVHIVVVAFFKHALRISCVVILADKLSQKLGVTVRIECRLNGIRIQGGKSEGNLKNFEKFEFFAPSNCRGESILSESWEG